jgi:LysM repeat protein
MMIICPKCKARNERERTTCQSCGADLLPGKSLGERLGCLAGGLVCGIFFVGVVGYSVDVIRRSGIGGLLSYGFRTLAIILIIAFFALGFLMYALSEAFRTVPEHEKYANRASRHLKEEPEQALADYSRAFELAPEGERGPYLANRGRVYRSLGRMEEALADYTKALELTPEREHGVYLEGRSGLYQELGRMEEATADLQAYLDYVERILPRTKGDQRANLLKKRAELLERLGRYAEAAEQFEAYLQAPGAEEGFGAKVFGELLTADGATFIEAYKADGVKHVKSRIDGLRQEALARGELVAVGYCQHCRETVEPKPDGKCPRCNRALARQEYVPTSEREAAAGRLKAGAEQSAKRGRRVRLMIAVPLAALMLLCVIVPLLSVVVLRRQPSAVTPLRIQPTAAATRRIIATRPTATPQPRTFQDNVFSFQYPGDWQVIDDAAVRVLLRTSLKGLTEDSYAYIGGVYTGSVETSEGCASIVLVVLKDASLNGQFSDSTYGDMKAGYETTMGERLLSIQQTAVDSLPAVEIVHIGASHEAQIHSLMIVPPEQGLAYSVTCSAHLVDYQRFAPAFDAALYSLEIAVPAETPQQRTYIVQAGDTLGKIANELGITVEALAQANNISDPNLIHVGQELVIP